MRACIALFLLLSGCYGGAKIAGGEGEMAKLYGRVWELQSVLLDGRHDIDLALIPAECINDNGVFLDDEPFITLREQLAMPVYPSYDFIDVLVHEGEPRVAEVAA